jgi:hypothetical protein
MSFCNKTHCLSFSQNTKCTSLLEHHPSVCSLIVALCLSVSHKALYMSVSQNSLCMPVVKIIYALSFCTLYMSVCLFVRTLSACLSVKIHSAFREWSVQRAEETGSNILLVLLGRRRHNSSWGLDRMKRGRSALPPPSASWTENTILAVYHRCSWSVRK